MMKPFAAALALATLTAFGMTAMSAAPAVAQASEQKKVEIPELVLGNKDATVTLTEYASYTCPHCANFHSSVFKELKRDYIDTGKIKFVYREVFFDRPGLWAAMVARCGGEMRYFGIQEMLYAQQKDWAAGGGEATSAALQKIGLTAGLSQEQLNACMTDGATAQALIETYEANVKADGITSTPSLIINGTRHGNMNYADLKALLDAELAK